MATLPIPTTLLARRWQWRRPNDGCDGALTTTPGTESAFDCTDLTGQVLAHAARSALPL